MGPSGAGKTTLMNALNGYTPPAAGQVLLQRPRPVRPLRRVPRHGGLRAAGRHHAPRPDRGPGPLLHRPAAACPRTRARTRSASGSAKWSAQLGLEGTENVLIGSPEKKGISGGQRKRVNLAMELLTDPAVLFLDEPTSGLSSEDALMVMKLLRKLADGGKTIIVTIHQPSLDAYRLLDNLILVSKDAKSPEPGRLAYFGPAYPQAVDFFNPGGVPGLKPGQEPSPDEVLRGLGKDKTAAWVERYQASPLKRQFVDERAGKQPDRGGPSERTRNPPRLWLRPVADARAAVPGDQAPRHGQHGHPLGPGADDRPAGGAGLRQARGRGSDPGELARGGRRHFHHGFFAGPGRAVVRLLELGAGDRRRMGRLPPRADGQPQDPVVHRVEVGRAGRALPASVLRPVRRRVLGRRPEGPVAADVHARAACGLSRAWALG